MELEKLPSYTYVTIKYQLSKINFLNRQLYLLVFLSLLFSLLLLPLIVITLLLCLLYKKLIDLILQYKIGFYYRGQLRGVDSICCNQECCTPSFFMFVDYPKSYEALRQDFVDFFTRKCRYSRHEKMFYSWSTFFGYHYFYKNTLEAVDYVTIAKDDGVVIRTKQDFANVIMQYDTKPMPDDDHAMFHFIIYPQRVELPNGEGCKLVCMKMHHALGDGKAFLSWLMADLADKEQKDVNVKNCNTNGITNGNGHIPKRHEKGETLAESKLDFLGSLRKTLIDDKIKVLASEFYDDNILCGKALKEEKFICWFSDQTSEYMDKIRTIKKSRAGVTFLDVANTCISASLQDYYKKHVKEDEIPSEISVGIVLSPANYSFQYGDTNFTFSNEFSVGGFRLPIGMENDLFSKLNFCQKQYQAIKDSIDVKFYYWLSDIFSLLPCQLPRFCAENLMCLTAGMSSLPGSERAITIFGGNQVKDIILMPPNSPNTGLHFVFCSYGKNMRISLTVDTSVIGDFDEAQGVVDGVIKHLDELYSLICNEKQKKLE